MEKVFLLGFGISGKSACRLLLRKGFLVTVCDKNIGHIDTRGFNGVCFCDEKKDNDFSKFSFMVFSTGIPRDHFLIAQAKKHLNVISDVEFGLSYIKNRLIGVTATNAKTTIVSMIEFILNKKGIKAKAIGNIGIGVCDFVEKTGVFIVELSSFALVDLNIKAFDTALIANIEQDHLSWHKNLENYENAKINLQHCLKENGELIVSLKVFKNYEKRFLKKPKIFDLETIDQNKAAVYSVLEKFGISFLEFLKFQKDFFYFQHRLEYVKTKLDVFFVNDSKSTNPASTLYATKQIKTPIILIVGGDDKNLSFKLWNKLPTRVKYIFAIGKTRYKIKKQLKEKNIFVTKTLKKAIFMAYKKSKAKDTIVLSPGCSSFDQFEDYKDRGEEFRKCVRVIETGDKYE